MNRCFVLTAIWTNQDPEQELSLVVEFRDTWEVNSYSFFYSWVAHTYKTSFKPSSEDQDSKATLKQRIQVSWYCLFFFFIEGSNYGLWESCGKPVAHWRSVSLAREVPPMESREKWGQELNCGCLETEVAGRTEMIKSETKRETELKKMPNYI